MKIINYYLQERVQAGTQGKINAPTFIYWVLYGKYPTKPFYGRTGEHPQVIVNGIGIDKMIPMKAIKELMAIKEIETRSSCQGENKDKPTFLIIRFKDNIENNVKSFVSKINKFKDIKCNYDIGNEGQIRIGITTLLWYDKDPESFKRWWIDLPTKIKKCI